ncbi:MAG: Dabb family protein [Candidatus Zixiibacteriota bacterium]
MIKHVVLFNMKETKAKSRQENAEELKSLLEKLPGLIEEIKEYEVGMNINTNSDLAMDLILISSFSDEQALQNYRIHPEHKKILSFIKENCEELRVIDYYI